MKRTIICLALSVAFLSFLACGDDSLTKQDATKVYGAAAAAAGSVQSGVQSGLAEQGKADAVTAGDFTYDWDGENYSFEGSVDSTEGGSASASGSGTVAGNVVSFDFSMVLDGWTSQGIVLDGSLSMSVYINGAHIKLEYSGDIDASGEIVGSAEFDLKVETEDGSVTMEGTVAGHKIGASANVDISDYL